ncbi:MAG: aminotransferase class IV [Planctomycetota bacterium]|nr:aminotransferase class IV [Planctomycetota bacterium]
MSRLAYLNGQFVPDASLSVPIHDAGFVQGVTVAEQLRTCGGKLFRLDEHLERLQRSLEIVDVPGIDLPSLGKSAQELASNNHKLLAPGDDLGLSLFVTPGAYPTFAPPGPREPTIGMHTYPIPFHLWHEKYTTGERLVVSSVRQVPHNCWPLELKCRSRMHYYLADREACQREPGARALLLDQENFIAEASTASVVLFRDAEGFLLPPREKILPGVSVGVLEELAREMGIAFLHRDLTVDDVYLAEEVILCSTSPCLLPVVSLDGRPIGTGTVGRVLRQALAAWSSLVGLDIVEQAHRFSKRDHV